RPQLLTERLVDGTENVVGFEMFAIDAAACANVVAHLFQPGKLIGRKANSGFSLSFEPCGEAFADVFIERFEWSCGFDSGADERHQVGEATCLGGAAHRAAATVFLERVPKSGDGLRTEFWF